MNKKIAFILPLIITKNGVAKQALELARELTNNGYSIRFYTYLYNSGTTFPDFNNFEIKAVRYSVSKIINLFTTRIFQTEQIYLYISLLNIYKFIKLFNKNDSDVITSHDWFSMWIGSRIKADNQKLISIINDVPVRSESNPLDKIRLFIDRLCVFKTDSIVVLDNNNRKAVQKWLKVTDKKIHIIRSGIDKTKYIYFKDKFNYRKKYKLSDQAFIIVCANILAWHRKYEDIIMAIYLNRKISHKCHLFILSKTDSNLKYYNFLMNLAAGYNLADNVHFIDKYFSDYERMELIKGADVLIFPNYPQTWGLTVLEAMALKTPVILSDGCGVSEVLHSYKDAIIYEKGNVRELSQAIEYSINNPDVTGKMAKYGKSLVTKTYTFEKYAEEISRLFN